MSECDDPPLRQRRHRHLLAQIGVSTCQRVADQLGLASTTGRGGPSGWCGHSTTTTRDLVQLTNHLAVTTASRVDEPWRVPLGRETISTAASAPGRAREELA